MERIIKFKEDYWIAIKNLSDEKKGQFIKMLCEYFFEDKEGMMDEENINLYFNLLKSSLDKEKEELTEAIIEKELSLNESETDRLRKMYGKITDIQDLIDLEVCKLFYDVEARANGEEEITGI